MPLVIAIDGPAGAGKSTVARRVSKELGFTYLDTGAMYRSVAWKALQGGIGSRDCAALEAVAGALAIRFSPLADDGSQRVWVDGEDVTALIRTSEVSDLTSRISTIASVRAVVVEQQRRIADGGAAGLVLEGRDIGTVVFPHAQLKIFLTASVQERARRRQAEMAGQGLSTDAQKTLVEMMARDERDSHRGASPLAIARDAVVLDTDGLSIDDVVQRIVALWKERHP